MSKPTIQIGKFKFKPSDDMGFFFKDELEKKAEEEVDEEEAHSKAELEAEYERGKSEVEAVFQPQLAALQEENQRIEQEYQQRINSLTESMSVDLSQLQVEFSEAVCEMSMKLAEVMLRQQPLKKEKLLELIQDSLKGFYNDAEIKIKVNSQDHSFIASSFNSEMIQVVEDTSLNVGEATINHRQGFVDLTFESRFQVLKDHFDSVKSGVVTDE
ncbi:MAG: flagellar assembly protein FliH [Lentisphaeraceae bacterium]|nr:flagellar assembly protein FliH [Lentisphaeraceae bacterium]